MTDSTFDPGLQTVSRWLPRSAVGPKTLGPVRLLTRLAAGLSSRRVQSVDLGSCSVRLHRPAPNGRPLPALLWIHGGGFVIGTAAQDDGLCHHFSESLGIVVAAVEYRLAPEHPYPAPLEDCYHALTWLADQEYVDAGRVAVGGGSAGGGLAAALALLARDRGEPRIALQLLAYPMLDDRTANRSDIDESMFRLWNIKANRFGWESYAGRPLGSTDIDGLASPARSEDLSELPPAWIGVGDLDLFLDEAVAYARRLQESGVQCELNVVPGAFHAFDGIRPNADVSLSFRSAETRALSAVLSALPE